MSRRYYFVYDEFADCYDIIDSDDGEVVKTYYTYEDVDYNCNLLNQEEDWHK